MDYSKVTAFPGTIPVTKQQESVLDTLGQYPVLGQLCDTIKTVQSRRQALNLPNPGTIENINKETSKDVFLTNFFFTGLRADLNKSLSMNPAFQLSHSFSCGSPVLTPYSVAAFYGTDNVLLQGNLDNEKSLSARMHYGWTRDIVSKASVQIANGQTMCQLEQDVKGCDYSLNFKALNPSLIDGVFTGVATGSILQSLTPKLALGLEALYSRQISAYPADAAVNYYARYVSNDWIASLSMQASGSVLASFYRKVSDKVEAGVETSVSLGGQQQMMMGMPPTIEAQTTIGAKYEFRQSSFRGQINSDGKVSCYLEQRVLPVMSILFAGEIDHKTQQPRIGVGLSLEAGGEEPFQHAEAMGLSQPRPPM